MKLKSIRIQNYRSIHDLTFPIKELSDKTYTYWLIGVNEAGKSSILKAIALVDSHNKIALNTADFQDKTKPISIELHYIQWEDEINECNVSLGFTDTAEGFSSKELWEVKLTISFTSANLAKEKKIEFLWAFSDEEHKERCEKELIEVIYKNSHYIIFWEYADKYLITNQISLSQFASDPENTSIPLYHCFELCGYDTDEKISQIIQDISSDSTEMESLQESLWERISALIKERWKNHNIIISFQISWDYINFHVKDWKWKKAKTTLQRSDGFKQFISFLLNISVQGEVNSLSNTLILLDEPETHLHPQAQEYFLEELTKLTKKDNNICLFATHSNHMIDKVVLERNFRILKESEKDTTLLIEFSNKTSTYASVNYEVFGISSSDYFNELYWLIHQKFQNDDPNNDERQKIKNFDTEYLHKTQWVLLNKPWKGYKNSATLPTYIRNCINHPDNRDTYTKLELKEAIEKLISFR